MSRSAVGRIAVAGSVAPRRSRWLSVAGFGYGCAISPILRDSGFHGSHDSGVRGSSVKQYIRVHKDKGLSEERRREKNLN